jgi:hypothetical protein
VLQNSAPEGDLAASARKLQDPAAALRAEVRKRRADQLD